MRSAPAIQVLVTIVLATVAGPAGSLSGQATASATTVSAPSSADDALSAFSPGDAIRLVFWREPDLNGDFPVDENGDVVLPILGVQSITGLEPAELRTRLTTAYRGQLRNQEVGITFLRRVRVLGAVSEPGLYFVDPTMTMGDAIALAGGPNDRGRLDGISFLDGSVLVRKDLGRDDLFAEELFAGDRIQVPERSWMSRHSTVLLGGLISGTAIVLSRILIR